MNLDLCLSHPPPPNHHHHPRKPGPSCLRRGTEAQEAAEKAASSEHSTTYKKTAEVAAQTEKVMKETCDTAVQADLPAAAVEAAHHHEAAQAGHLLPAVEAALGSPVVEAARHSPVLQVKQLPPAELARPWLPHHQPVHDALYPDLQFGVAEYLPRHVSADTPQVDGNELQTWSCIKGFEIQNTENLSERVV